LPDIEYYAVDLESKMVTVATKRDAQDIFDKIRDSGYSPELIAS